MIRLFKYSLFVFLVVISNACNNTGDSVKKTSPLNVILLIGDGMGVSAVSANFYFNPGETNFKRFPFTGLINTSSASHKITDSAAGATAFGSGIKSYNGAIGVDINEEPKETIIEVVSRKNLKTGVIATSSITHATPAAFYSHVKQRGMQEQIAEQLADSDVDFFAGGGIKWLTQRSDNANLFEAFATKGFLLDTIGLSNSSLDPNKKYGYLFAPDGMPTFSKGRGDFLPDATRMAIDYLSANKDGFFLMVEGSQIDWAGHANDPEYMMSEMLDFDKTIGVALDFAEKNGNTLVIVTADHETGGMALSPKVFVDEDGEHSDYNQPVLTFATGGHTSTLIPVFTLGPGAEDFSGIYENTDIYHRIMRVTGWLD